MKIRETLFKKDFRKEQRLEEVKTQPKTVNQKENWKPEKDWQGKLEKLKRILT